MSSVRISVTADSVLIRELDRLVARKVFANRSEAVQEALRDKIGRAKHVRLAREAAKLDAREERLFAEEKGPTY